MIERRAHFVEIDLETTLYLDKWQKYCIISINKHFWQTKPKSKSNLRC